MTQVLKDIKIHVHYEGKYCTLETYNNEYRNLMALIYDKIFIGNFGECKGIGRCGTCHIQVLEGNARLLQREGNEVTTLNKMAAIAPTSRLACNILIDEKINSLRLQIMIGDDPGLY